MLERDLETKLRTLVKKAGGVIYKLDARAHKGAPDRVVQLPGKPTVFVELKTETGKLSPLQQIELERIIAAGGNTRVLYGVDAVKEFVGA